MNCEQSPNNTQEQLPYRRDPLIMFHINHQPKMGGQQKNLNNKE